ncbi:MAG: SH3 domain-containing C40 family peptidase [Bacteroidia bacterium]|nr:SH3 domain-containing C40 family peptidase [Bacteroidia bacterium]
MRLQVIFISLLCLAGCNSHELPLQVRKDVNSIAVRWVPDKREGICRFTVKMLTKDALVIKGETNLPEAKNEIFSYLGNTGLEIIDSLKMLPDTSEIEKTWGLVTVSVCNIKSKPSYSSEQVSQAIMGTPVKILKEDDGWFLIQTPDHYLGWTNDSGISEMNEAEMRAWKQSDRLIYTCKSGDILSETDSKSVVSDITAGAILEIISEGRDFFRVEIPDGRYGIINKKDAIGFNEWCSSIKPEADKFTAFAKSLNGSPYMWGGTSTKAADCSGFVKTIYFTGGIILARDASQQFLYGQPVDISSSIEPLEPGDLIFFGHLNDDGEKRITHVGMYIGDTEVIHSSGMVRINSLDSTRTNFNSYLKKTIMGARKIIGEESHKGTESVALHSWYINL